MTADPPTDEALLAAHVAGDAAAFPALFGRYGGLVAAVVGRDLRGPHERDELVQETFLHLHRAARDYRADRGPLRPWLLTIARNVRREHFRRLGRRPEVTLDLDGSDDPPVAPEPLAWADARDARGQVDRALRALPDAQRQVIELHWFGDLSFAEIATTVGASVAAVKVRAHRGYERMRALLAGEAG